MLRGILRGDSEELPFTFLLRSAGGNPLGCTLRMWGGCSLTLVELSSNIWSIFMRGVVMIRKLQKKNGLVHGVGINDADYVVKPTINGKRLVCPYYEVWHSMIGRCYYHKYQERQPTYKGCSVSPDWISFMNFRKWMMRQDWLGKQLDKDLLVVGNKVYSPSTCVFVDQITNGFTNTNGRSRGEYPLGVRFHKPSGRFEARCGNPFTKKVEHLGYFTCPNEAHLAWKARKHELANQLADLQTDERVANALRTRYTESFLAG